MKKNIFSDKICNMLNLKSITTRSFVYLVDCILLGIVMVKVPERNAFKLYFTIFLLCKKTLKDCLDMPIVQKVIVDDKNMDFYLREELSPDNVNSAIQKILEQVPFVPAQNISFEKLKSFLIEVTEKDSTISSNFVLKMKIYRMIYDVALIRNDTETAIYIYDLISNEILQWDKEIFEYWFGDKESYLKRLQEYDKNRNCLLDNLKCNLDESKILKLHKYVFL
nr:hypothetical protein [uncultured Prevotella sp.]